MVGVPQYYKRAFDYNKHEHASEVSNAMTALAGFYISFMDANTIGFLCLC